jgi:hypothetical protein
MTGAAMKADDFKKCRLCGKGMMHTGLPLFWRARIERMGIDMNEVQRAGGMEQMMFGNVGLARVFYDPDIAKPVHDPVEILLCEKCALEPHPLALLAESA